MEEYLAQPRYKGKGLDPALSDETDFVDYSWKVSPSLRSGWGG